MPKSTKSSNFSKQRNILNFRPNIHFVEPEQIDEPKTITAQAPTLDAIKTDVSDLIANYKTVETTADALQDQISDRAASVSIKLDPVHDAHILASVQRHFGNPNKTEITYDDYLNCIKDINNAGPEVPVANQQDIFDSTSDQYRTIFGSLGAQSGLARPELNSYNQTIAPIDLSKFVTEQVDTLFKTLTPLINDLIVKKIKELNPF